MTFNIGNFWEIPLKNKLDLYIKAIAIFCLLNILSLLPDIYDIYSKNGLISSDIVSQYLYPYSPKLEWILSVFNFTSIDNGLVTQFIVAIYILSLFFIIMKYKPLISSIIAWVLHVMFVNSSYFFSYGADYFITFGLFMVILFTIAENQKNEDKKELFSVYAIRFIQIHLCMVYFFAGAGKALGTDWFDGNAIWYVINTYAPDLSQAYFYKMLSYPMALKILGWGTLIFELFYPILIYFKKTRKLTLITIISLHIGIMVVMNFYTFGLIMILLNLVAFGHYFTTEYQAIKLFLNKKKMLIQFK